MAEDNRYLHCVDAGTLNTRNWVMKTVRIASVGSLNLGSPLAAVTFRCPGAVNPDTPGLFLPRGVLDPGPG